MFFWGLVAPYFETRNIHFYVNRCGFHIVEYDEDMNIVSAEALPNVDHDEFGCGGVIEHVLGLGVDGILAAGMGRPPLMRFTENGVVVYAETSTPNVGDAARPLSQTRSSRQGRLTCRRG